MRTRLRHRGPDGEGEAFRTFAALAHTRLAMVDAKDGAQPIRSPDGRYTLTYNGELFNDAELRAELPGPWRTRSDAETVLAAWMHWGSECVSRLDGMFAFFLWDQERDTGFAVRDRLGVKPFAYRNDGVFAFASEAKALVPEAPAPDVGAIVEYLVAPAFSGVVNSPFAGIHYLPPGHILRVDREGITLDAYWKWKPEAGDVTASAVREELASAVRASLWSDVPLGIFLSGGLDSSAIAAYAGPRVRDAFTIVFEGQDRWDGRSALVVSNDTPYAHELGRELSLRLHDVVHRRAHLAEDLRTLALTNDALPAWEQELSQRTLARAASEYVKGVLVGDAADETFYGYHFLLDDIATSGPCAIFERLGSVPVREEIDPDPIGRLDEAYRALAGPFDSRRNRIASTTQLIVQRWLPRLLHNGDIHTMSFGLEARVPFCSKRLLDVAMRVDIDVALNHGIEKWLLRDALRGIVPERIRTRRKSALPKDQDAPYQDEMARVCRDPHPLVKAIVDLPAMASRLDHRDPGEALRAQWFRTICLQHWATAYNLRAP